ncbi:Alpha/Beta hydrolase protein [Dactylonectria macrodidyma]|uniref:Carboxylic ester hydrolase n=1 Tax=Dactylonectria macrodidyma TaxID=307937 RepID=A0A9P9J5H7_9HYPO|nr:Alpha/Beta hydrolase protein [Dactylonectria macrodidyma]
MPLKLFVVYALGLFLGFALGSPYAHQNGLTVQTSSGKLHGFMNSTSPRTRQFLGIQYAKSPVGNLRFRPPVKHTSSRGLSATKLGPTCMQDPQNSGFVLYRSMGMGAFLPSEADVFSEDCLYLNVYAPTKRSATKLPVGVWIHGGGFAICGASVPYQIPDQWVSRTQSHIVVTLNYRLKIFGYPNSAMGTENVGLLDQRMAIEWVRDNIESFGGDPSRIVLWGQSAGAFSVNYYSMAYPTDPIAYGFISDSGGDFPSEEDTSHGNFSAVAAQVGCGGLDARSEFKCVQKANATDLVRTVDSLAAQFVPQADNKTVFADPENRIRRVFRPRLDVGIPIYRYVYAGNFSNITPLPQLGAAHSAELPLIFGTHYQFHQNSTQFEYEVSWAMQDLWLSFITNPQRAPRTAKYNWPKLETADGNVAAFALDGTTVQSFPKAQLLICAS